MSEKITEREHREFGVTLALVQSMLDKINARVESAKPKNDLNISRSHAVTKAVMDLRAALESTMFSENADLFANRDTNGARAIYFPVKNIFDIPLIEDTDYVLPENHQWVWITVDGFSVQVRRVEQAVSVDIYGKGYEDQLPISSCAAELSDLADLEVQDENES